MRAGAVTARARRGPGVERRLELRIAVARNVGEPEPRDLHGGGAVVRVQAVGERGADLGEADRVGGAAGDAGLSSGVGVSTPCPTKCKRDAPSRLTPARKPVISSDLTTSARMAELVDALA
ncbi:MAG: hypothetical protein KIT31_10760 [Deltaproteobacteria bacterium]|nr:hypothetical protein [Deltaproteobacteria bacterium]